MKRLIINADDFGFTTDVNAGIIAAHREGVLTAATLMGNGEAFEDAVRLARETPTLDIGCHLVLVQGRSVATGRTLPQKPIDLLRALARGKIDVQCELRGQIERIVGAGIRPTHLDSHKHTHILPGIFREVVRLAEQFNIPYVRLPLDHSMRIARVPCAFASRYYRRFAYRHSVRMTDHFLGFRLTGSLDKESLAAALSRLPDGVTEFMCHPGYLRGELASALTRLKDSRVRELEALTSPRIRDLIAEQRIELSNFSHTLDR